MELKMWQPVNPKKKMPMVTLLQPLGLKGREKRRQKQKEEVAILAGNESSTSMTINASIDVPDENLRCVVSGVTGLDVNRAAFVGGGVLVV